MYAEFVLPKNVSDAGTNFVSEWFKEVFMCQNIDQVVTSLYHHHSNGEVVACIKFVKCTIKKCRQINNDTKFASRQIRSTPIGAGIPSLAMLFNRPIRVLLLQIEREQIDIVKDYKY